MGGEPTRPKSKILSLTPTVLIGYCWVHAALLGPVGAALDILKVKVKVKVEVYSLVSSPKVPLA